MIFTIWDMKNNIKKIIKAALVAAFWIFIWYIISKLVAREILVPSPIRTLEAFFSLIGKRKFQKAVLFSLLRIFAGFFLAAIFGILGAILSYRFRFFEAMTSPLLSLIRAIPVASFIILALVWIKTNMLPVFISFFTVMPIIWDSVLSGMKDTNKAALEAAAVDGAGKTAQIFFIILPSLRSTMLTAFISGFGFAWKSGIAAEIISRPKTALGTLIQDAKMYLESPELFALTGTVILLSFAIEKLLKHILNKNNCDRIQ